VSTSEVARWSDLWSDAIGGLERSDSESVTAIVARTLETAQKAAASDIHFIPTTDGLAIRWRVDGVLHEVGALPRRIAPNVVSRLKVLADLLTYRTDIPQEGRIRQGVGAIDMRLTTLPTLHGEMAIVRVFGEGGPERRVGELGLPSDVAESLARCLGARAGMLVIAGPAGAGKTTTLYACLRELAMGGEAPRSIITLEDPIEAAVAGVAQSQVNSGSGYDLVTGLRAIVRQDPEVIGVGEIRDRAAAAVAVQAALTGHLVLTTFHAESAAGALARLLDMGIEAYALRSSVRAILAQRLARRLCDCARRSEAIEDRAGFDVASASVAVGCEQCRGTGYQGRLVIAEFLDMNLRSIASTQLEGAEGAAIERVAIENGMISRWARARDAIERGLTSAVEVRRVMGFEA
jgi:type II secretory ATPase GspE/PulE/Tfp pilus assembly ATPase PilB-like protein